MFPRTIKQAAVNLFAPRWGKVLLAALAYGWLNYLLREVTLPGCPIISLRPQIVIPILSGLLWGVGPGALVGLCGNLLGDYLAGFGLRFAHFTLANGIIGGLPGLYRLQPEEKIDSLRRLGMIFLMALAANGTGLFLAAVLHVFLIPQEMFRQVAWTFLIPAVLINLLTCFLLLPLGLTILKRMRYTLDLRLGVMLIYILVPALVIVYIVAFRLHSIPDYLHTLGVSIPLETAKRLDELVGLSAFRVMGVTTVVVVTVGFGVSLWFILRLLVPVRRLTEAVEALRQGEWRPDILRDQCERSDEFGALAVHVQKMGDRVHQRQLELEQQIAILRRQVHHEAVDREASQITDSDYFKSIQEKVRRLKRGRHEKN